MKTYEMAKSLNQLAKILRSGPNIEMVDFTFKPEKNQENLSREEIALNISTLLALSKVKKHTWVEFVEENRWSLEIPPRDSSRNIIGKILKYLDSHPDALKKLKSASSNERGGASTELLNALSSLMNNN